MNVTQTRPVRPRLAVVVSGAVVALLLLLTACQRELGDKSLTLVNESRARHGQPALVWDDQAAAKAQKWAERLAKQGRLEHSRLADGMSNWRALGENVGVHSNIDNVHQLFLNSPGHRNTMLSGTYNAVGIGTVIKDGRYYIVQVYRG